MQDEVERARSALFSLDPGCARAEWVRYGMAAKQAGLSFDDFHSWSAQAPNYRGECDCRKAWASFGDGAVKTATLYYAARTTGWQPGQGQSLGLQPAWSQDVKALASADGTIRRGQRSSLASTFDSYPPADVTHPYIVAKRGIPDGLHVVPNDDPLTINAERVAGCLAVPVRSLDGALLTVQYIPPQGTGKKVNAPGASFGEGMLVLGEMVPDGRAYVCEGIGTAWAVLRADPSAAAVVAFGSGRFRIVALALRRRYPLASIVLVPDRGKESEAQVIAGEVRGSWVEMPADKPMNYDANDYEAEHDSDALKRLLAAVKRQPMRYRLQAGEELLTATPLRWLVRGVLPAEGLAALYGPSGSGKSFLALDLCAAIAAGAPAWFGHRLSAAPVTYCALEGERGMGKRARAWSTHYRQPLPGRLRFITQGIDLRQHTDISDLAAAVQAAGGRDGLVVIDTLNRAAPGADENASKDMGQLIGACKELQRRIGGLVLLVHHTGKDGTRGLRGHSSLYAALDAAVEVTRADNRREWFVAKCKDDEDGERHTFLLRVMELDCDEHGDPVTSCIVAPDEGVAEVYRVKVPQGGNQRIALDALAQPLRESQAFGKGDAPLGHPCLKLDDAVVIVADHLPCDPKRKTERARHAISGLVARGICGVKDDWLWRW